MLNAEVSPVDYVDLILQAAIAKSASDIHIEPYSNQYRIRFRLDGVVKDIERLNTDFAVRVIARLKVLACIDVADKKIPQDGRLNIRAFYNKKIALESLSDARLSTCPTIMGEKLAIRLPDNKSLFIDIESLGFDSDELKSMEKILALKQGMVLVVGPTGSGKTTTLYAILNRLNRKELNIITAEDPVEIILNGINQIQVNTKIDLNFSRLLRGFLRQDPDVIMIGEIRDYETAEIAAQASQTGHLIFSTLHTAFAIDAITRLIGMGIPRYQINSIKFIIAQRLFRKLCASCKKKDQLNNSVLEFLRKKHSLDIHPQCTYIPVGCKLCMSGYKGRISVYEILEIDEDIRMYILDESISLSELSKHIKQRGLTDLYQKAMKKVIEGVISIEEFERVLGKMTVDIDSY